MRGQTYSWANIHALLSKILNQKSFRDISASSDDLNEMATSLPPEADKEAMIEHVMQYTKQTDSTADLLGWVKEYIPDAYTAYAPYEQEAEPIASDYSGDAFEQQTNQTIGDFPPAPPPRPISENMTRSLIAHHHGVDIYVSNVEKPWAWPANGFVIPVDPYGSPGRVGQGFADFLKIDSDVFSLRNTYQEVEEIEIKMIHPEDPVAIQLPSDIQYPQLPSASTIEDRFIIAATLGSDESVTNIPQVIESVINLCIKDGLSHITLPLFELENLNASTIMQATLPALFKAIPIDPTNPSPLKEITIVTLDEEATNLALNFLNRRSQSPLNDTVLGEDLLNVTTEAHALAETLLLRDLEPPLSVGILGGWGSGKSFVMHLMQQKMSDIRCQAVTDEQAWGDDPKKLSTFAGHVYQIRFDAWTYAKSNLWASLMQSIFFELNRQLSLEKRLAQALAPDPSHLSETLRQGGPIWQALNEMSEEQLKVLLNQKDPTLFRALEKAKSAQQFKDLLWNTLQELKEDQRAALRETEKELAQQKVALEEAKENLHRQVDEEIVQAAKEAAWDPIEGQLQALLGSAVKNFKEQVNQTAFQGQATLSDILRPRFAGIRNLLRRNPIELIVFILFALLSISLPILQEQLTQLQLPGWIVGLGSIVLAISRTLDKWDKAVMDSYTIYREQVDKERTRIEGERDIRLEKLMATHKTKLNEDLESASTAQDEDKALQNLAAKSNISAIELQIEKLEAQAKRQRQNVGMTAHYVSLVDFVSARLDDAFYERELGLMHQVQRDLTELTEGLLSIEKELFPRGPARVVLYIDDLDRCPPERVVEVLEATQLLLKTKLFVVILALDVRYVVRALEKVYKDILIRRGQPSGLDYIEKIIQIPYRVRPIERDALSNYLRGQMVIEALKPDRETTSNIPTPALDKPARLGQTETQKEQSLISPSKRKKTPNLKEPLPPHVIEFSQSEFQAILTCCQQISMTPRAIKRLINVSKLMKIIWFREGAMPETPIFQSIILLLALSEQYADVMRALFEDLILAALHSADDPEALTFHQVIAQHQPITDNMRVLQDLKNLQKVVTLNTLLPEGLTPAQMGLDTLNLVRSFCFVGEIGYDPDEK